MKDIIIISSGTIDEIEKQTILYRYRMYQNNKTQTSISLGISIRTLDNKLERYENESKLERERFERERQERAAIVDRMRGVPQAPQLQQSAYRADSGIHMESVAKIPSQQQMPMSEQPQIQNVLPKQAPASGQKGRR